MALLWVWLLCGLLCCVSVRGTVDQLEYPTFIYHSHKNLLLATTSNNCYYIRIDTATSPQMNNDDSRLELEHRIIDAIWRNVGVSDVTLENVRNDFSDLLADFHCLDKTVHELALHVEPPTTATTTTQPTHPTTYPTTHPPTYPTTHPPTYPTTHPPTHPTTHPTTYPTTYPTTHPTAHPTHPTHDPHPTPPHLHGPQLVTHPIGPQPVSTELALHDCPHAQPPDTFQLMADVAFLLDVSTSVTDQDFRLVKQFIDAMTQHFDFGPHGLQLSVTEYDRFPHPVFDFNTFQHPDQVKHAIDQLREVQSAQHTDQTFTGAALHFIRDHVFTAMSGDRHEAPNVLVIISDGSNIANQDHQELIQQAQLLHNDGVQIIVIGIGDNVGDQSDLAQIANDGFSFLHLDYYTQLHDHGITDYIRNVMCTEVYAHTSPP